jgi:hypothetical protein
MSLHPAFAMVTVGLLLVNTASGPWLPWHLGWIALASVAFAWIRYIRRAAKRGECR